MSIKESYAQGTPSWVDLATTDIDGAREFYGELLGWEFVTESDPEARGYTMALLKGRAAAAVMPQPQEQTDMGVPPMWNQYITVNDVDAVAGQAESLGGSLAVEPFDVFTAGRMAVVADPTGAMVALWQPGDSIGSEIVNELGAFCWAELVTGNQAVAGEFYSKLLGLTTAEMDMGSGGMMTMFMVGEEAVGSAMDIPMEGVPPHWHVYFAVEDADAALSRVTDLGGTVLAPAMDIPPGRFGVVADPAGAVFSLIALAEQPD